MNRPAKGRSLIEFPDGYTVVDLETTGTSSKWDKIIEVGAARIQHGEVVDTFQELVNPGYDIGPFIEELTGITNEMLADVADIDEVLPRFKVFLGDDVMVGHNIASFDANFLYDAGENAGIRIANDFVDTMRISRKLHKSWEHNRLRDLRKHYGITDVNAHRALADALATARAFECMRAEAIDAYGTLDEFVRMASRKVSTFRGGAKSFEDIAPTVTTFDEMHPFYGREVVITGTLRGMSRREAAQEIVNVGGIFSDTLKKKTTNYLVVADYSACKTIRGQYSGKHKKALDYQAKGADIEIIDEDTFFDMLSS